MDGKDNHARKVEGRRRPWHSLRREGQSDGAPRRSPGDSSLKGTLQDIGLRGAPGSAETCTGSSPPYAATSGRPILEKVESRFYPHPTIRHPQREPTNNINTMCAVRI